MIRILLIVFYLVHFSCLTQQQSTKIWLQTGVKSHLNSKLEWGIDLSKRFGNQGLETFFSEISFKYKVTKWWRQSLDYRMIFDKNNQGNYALSNRININSDFKKQYNRLILSFRVRYQYSFTGRMLTNYDAEFDQAIRLKPQLSFKSERLKLNPIVSMEFFYNPSYSPKGRQFTKKRLFIGFQRTIRKSHELALGYILDEQINAFNPELRHIVYLSYTFEFFRSKGKMKD
jgi:hypothetical protein